MERYYMLIIKNGKIIDPIEDAVYPADLYVKDGVIAKMVRRSENTSDENCGYEEKEKECGDVEEESGSEVLDAKGMLIAPGLADTHVHFRDPGFTYKEDILSGAEAAKKGGYTQIVLMANTKPCVDQVETLQYVLQKGAQTGIHIHSCANVTMGMTGKELVDMEQLSEAGAVGFTDDGVPILSEEMVTKAMEQAALCHKPISFHEEDPKYSQNNGVNAGKAAAFYGIGGSKRDAEITMIERDIRLALQTGATVVIQHISTKEGVELVRKGKAAGADVHAEATPHHFTLTQEAVRRHGTLAKMNPPLRLEEDRLAIIQGLQDGTIDMIATDHAPHSREEKEKPLTQAPSGIIGLELSLSLGIRELVKKGYLTMMELIRKMSLAPAKLYHLNAGYLAEGGPADLVVFDAAREWIAGEYVSKASNTPFTGERMPGVVAYTICNGRIVYRKDER